MCMCSCLLSQVPVKENLGSSVGVLVSRMKADREAKTAGIDLGVTAGDTIDVRDTAAIHVLALGKEEAAGARIITTDGEGPFVWQDICAHIFFLHGVPCSVEYSTYHTILRLSDDIFAKAYPDAPKGTPGAGKEREDVRFDRTAALNLFPDFVYRTREESVTEMGAQFDKAGYFEMTK